LTEVIFQLREEHKNIARVLNVLEAEMAVFAQADRPDYDVLVGIADYFTGFPDRCHHPKEDLILKTLQARDPVAAQPIGALEAEHERTAAATRRFQEAVGNILLDAEISRGAVIKLVHTFIEDERRHMSLEEEKFFPTALKVLTAEDWAAIDGRLMHEDDPLFGAQVAKEYEDLRTRILLWEEEDHIICSSCSEPRVGASAHGSIVSGRT